MGWTARRCVSIATVRRETHHPRFRLDNAFVMSPKLAVGSREMILHFSADPVCFGGFVDVNVSPADLATFRNIAFQFDVMCEADRQSADLLRLIVGRHQFSPNCVATFAIQDLARLKGRFAVATTSPRQSSGDPVDSPRKAAFATEIPSSRPIK